MAASGPSTTPILTVGAGEIHALIGPNGAGKTTLFNLVSGLFPTDKGTIKLNGREIQRRAVRPHLPSGPGALVPDHQSVQGLSIYENLRLSLQAQSGMRFNVWRDIDSYASSTPRPPN